MADDASWRASRLPLETALCDTASPCDAFSSAVPSAKETVPSPTPPACCSCAASVAEFTMADDASWRASRLPLEAALCDTASPCDAFSSAVPSAKETPVPSPVASPPACCSCAASNDEFTIADDASWRASREPLDAALCDTASPCDAFSSPSGIPGAKETPPPPPTPAGPACCSCASVNDEFTNDEDVSCRAS